MSKEWHLRHEKTVRACAQVEVWTASAWKIGKAKRICRREGDIGIKIKQSCAGKPKQAREAEEPVHPRKA